MPSDSFEEAGKYYRHSGAFSASGLILGTLGAFFGVAIVAVLYAVVIYYIPFAGTITFLIAAGFGALAGFVAGICLQWGKLRNDAIAFLVSGLLAIEALYLSWAVWVSLLLRGAELELNLWTLLQNPRVLWSLVSEINQVGAWSMRGFTPTGGFLWLLWGLEALLVLGLATLVSAGTMTLPFCERCERWSTVDEDVARFNDPVSDSLKQDVEAGGVDFLRSLGKPSVKDTTWLRADLHRCSSCESLHALSLSRVQVTERKGERRENATNVLQHFLVSKSAAATLRELG
jgi:hypothetical protein